MDNYSHSRHPNRATTAVSKKICGNAGGFASATTAKTLYDDVYGGPPKFGVSTLSPRMEDYSEIFGNFQASRASSIPVLDLPTVDEAEVFFDVRSSSFDYEEVFGGFNGLDFAVSFEELVDQSKARHGDSSEEPWSPAEFESLSEDSDISGKDQSFSNGSPHHSFDGNTEFNISYHKANQILNEDISKGTTHVTHLHAVPGFTVMMNSPLQHTEDKRTSLQVTDDSNLDMDFSVDMLNAKHLKKTMSHPPNGSAGGHVFENDLRPQKGLDNYGFFNRDMFVGISEISLRTLPSELPPPCRPPPAVEGKNGDSSKPVNRNGLAFGEIPGDNSPPFFDVEVDASSSAAASAAAIKEAMESAQAKIKSAKELMEKKKEGLQTSSKSGSKKDTKEKGGKTGKSIDGSNRKKDETVKVTCEREDSGTYLFIREEKQKVATTAPEVAEFLGEKNFTAAEQYVKDKSEKESWSSTGSHKIDEASEWKEATEFFELVTTDESKIAFDKVNSKKTFVQNIKIQEHEQIEKATTVSLEKHSENGRKVKAAREDHELENFEKKQKGAKEPRGHGENNARSKATKEASEQNDGEKKVKVTHEVCEWGENNNSFTMAKPLVGTNKRTGADKTVKEKKTGADKSKGEQAIKQEENDHKFMEADKMFETQNKFKLFHESVGNREMQKEAFEAENEKTMQKGLEKEEDETRLEETNQGVERERRPRDAVTQQENGKGQQPLEQKRNKKKQKEALKLEDGKRREETLKKEVNEKRPKSVYEEKETRNGEKREGRGKEEREAKLLEEFNLLDNQIMPKEVLEQEETKQMLKDSVDWDDNKGLDKTHEAMEKGENKEVKLAEGTQVQMEEEDLQQSDEARNCGENTQSSQLTCEHDKNSGKVKATQESLAHEENSETRTATRDNEMQPGAVGRKNKSVDKNIKAPSTAEKYHFRMEGAGKELENKDFPSDGTVKKTSGEIKIKPKVSEKETGASGKENVLVGEKLKAFGKSQGNLEYAKNQCKVEDSFELPQLDNRVKKAGESASVIGQPYAEKINSSSQMDSVSENQEKEFARQWKEREDRTQAQATLNEEEKEKTIPTQLVKENAEDKSKIETARPARAEGKQKIQKSVQQGNASLAAERKEKTSGEVETERTKRELENERMKRERELENERLRKLEEEREREREREKDRMAVDLATLEARERAFSESRERSERATMERATAEARQRAMAEARERLEKACAEAREKSLAGKAAMEARIRAERSAVERATAEARERAAERAMAERAAFQARERVQRSVSDKFSASSRNNGMRQSSSSSDLQDLQFQSSQGHLRYQYSSVYGERYEGVEGESAQRCKARLERHRRTAERAAKALADKNMRDLLAQREQAERNRLAETLDADVRRWSSGKEGNLRALLSTLQYILGPDSGWQPIPLTEVITSAAVKKAYRKATLCVHPDKLQQRGASIQQKYICEKVFDLLKEAWNKFNSEER